MPVIATLTLTTGGGQCDVVLLLRDRSTLCDGGRGIFAEGPSDAVVLLERDRATLCDGGVFLQRRVSA